ncbi:MAG: hypothetical protein AABY13_05620, partial [Nanoarchaeota archaeon]
YGIFAGTLGILRTNSILAGFSKSTPMEPSPDNGLTWIATLQDPFPKGLLAAAGAGNTVEINAAQCNGHALAIREAEVCVNGVVMHAKVLMSVPY